MTTKQPTPTPYGQGDATYQAVGRDRGIKKLVDDFYDIMSESKNTQTILNLHPSNLSISRDKLYRFLSGWMGGPKLYRERYGSIDILRSHAHLPIDQSARDAWLWAMQRALKKQNYPPALADYLLKQLTVPADRLLAQYQSQQQASQ